MVLHTPARSIFDQRQHRSEIVGKCPIQPALRQSPLPRALIQNIYRERRRKPARVTALSKDWGTSVGLGQHCSHGKHVLALVVVGSRALSATGCTCSCYTSRGPRYDCRPSAGKCLQGCKQTVLIADIGGTNCRFELWRIDSSGEKKHKELYHRASLISENLLIPGAFCKLISAYFVLASPAVWGINICVLQHADIPNKGF